jgi:hypothetical protein
MGKEATPGVQPFATIFFAMAMNRSLVFGPLAPEMPICRK